MILKDYIQSTFGDMPPTPDRLAFEMEDAQRLFKRMWADIHAGGLPGLIPADMTELTPLEIVLIGLVVSICTISPEASDGRAWRFAAATELGGLS